MKCLKKMFLGVCALLIIGSCNNDDDNADGNMQCDFDIIINEDLYLEPSPSVYAISNVDVIDDCLEITIQSGGCDGSTWEVELTSTFPITNGFDLFANLSLKLINLEPCEAYLSNTYSFDISDLQDVNLDSRISLEGWDNIVEITN